jgi:hypothetical protein
MEVQVVEIGPVIVVPAETEKLQPELKGVAFGAQGR